LNDHFLIYERDLIKTIFKYQYIRRNMINLSSNESIRILINTRRKIETFIDELTTNNT